MVALDACTSFMLNEVQDERKGWDFPFTESTDKPLNVPQNKGTGRDFPFYRCTSSLLHEPQDEGRGWKILFRGGAKKP